MSEEKKPVIVKSTSIDEGERATQEKISTRVTLVVTDNLSTLAIEVRASFAPFDTKSDKVLLCEEYANVEGGEHVFILDSPPPNLLELCKEDVLDPAALLIYIWANQKMVAQVGYIMTHIDPDDHSRTQKEEKESSLNVEDDETEEEEALSRFERFAACATRETTGDTDVVSEATPIDTEYAAKLRRSVFPVRRDENEGNGLPHTVYFE